MWMDKLHKTPPVGWFVNHSSQGIYPFQVVQGFFVMWKTSIWLTEAPVPDHARTQTEEEPQDHGRQQIQAGHPALRFRPELELEPHPEAPHSLGKLGAQAQTRQGRNPCLGKRIPQPTKK